MSTGDLVNIQPSELKFPFELKKQSSCSMQLTNKTDKYVAFKVKTTNPKKYCVRPNTGIILPRTSCGITVTMQAQKEAPPDFQSKDKFLVLSVVAPDGASTKDIGSEMFTKEDDKVVEEFKLRVVYIPANTPSPVPEGSEEGSSPWASSQENENHNNSSYDDVSRSLEEPKEKSSEFQETMGQLKLFDDDDNDDVSKIEIDKEYAKRLEHNKKREELQRYEEMKKKGLIEESDSESSESDEDNNDIIGNSKKDLEFIKALLLVKKQDPSLKEKDVKLFDSESDGSEGEGEEEEEEKSENMGKKERKKIKAMYLKDVMAKQLIEEGPEFQEDNEENLGEKKKKKTYSEEQEEIKKAFLDAIKEDEGNEEEKDGFFIEKKKGDGGEEDVEDDDNDEFVKKLDEYFGGDDDLDDNKMFLKDFFKNKMWIDKDKRNKNTVIDEEVEDLLREDEELERQELYETTFRHEEEVEDRVMGHSRIVEGSVRKKENARKEQRKSKGERMKIAEMEREEELKHLKNLKKKEMKERMKKVMAIAGFNEEEDLPLNLKDLDDEFDPEDYDRIMKAMFDAKYYDAEDVDPQFGQDREEDDGEVEKPDFDKEDELLGLPKGWDVIESGDGFNATRERSLKHKLENGDNNDDSEGESEGGGNDDSDEGEIERGEEQEEIYEESKRKRKRKMSLVKKAKEEMLEEFYKLDYEDTIGDLKTRFKYAKVKPNRYGLKTEEILMLDEKDLNQYVSVKKLAPYREKEWKVPDSKRYQQKLKIKEVVHGQKSDGSKGGKKKRLKVGVEKADSEVGAKRDEKAQQEGQNSDMGNLSKRAKTRRRQAKPKLSHSRLIAYGKIPSKAKIKHRTAAVN